MRPIAAIVYIGIACSGTTDMIGCVGKLSPSTSASIFFLSNSDYQFVLRSLNNDNSILQVRSHLMSGRSCRDCKCDCETLIRCVRGRQLLTHPKSPRRTATWQDLGPAWPFNPPSFPFLQGNQNYIHREIGWNSYKDLSSCLF